MVRIVTMHLDVNRRPEALTEGAKEVRHQLGGQSSHGFAVEAASELREGPPERSIATRAALSSIGSKNP